MFSGGERVITCASRDLRRCGRARLGEQERAAHVDVHHQSNFLAASCSVGSVAIALALLTHDVDAPEALDGRVDGPLHVLFVADVADHGQPLGAGCLDLGDCGVHGSRQLRVGFGRSWRTARVGAQPAAPSAIARPIPRLPPDTTKVRVAEALVVGRAHGASSGLPPLSGPEASRRASRRRCPCAGSR